MVRSQRQRCETFPLLQCPLSDRIESRVLENWGTANLGSHAPSSPSSFYIGAAQRGAHLPVKGKSAPDQGAWEGSNSVVGLGQMRSTLQEILLNIYLIYFLRSLISFNRINFAFVKNNIILTSPNGPTSSSDPDPNQVLNLFRLIRKTWVKHMANQSR